MSYQLILTDNAYNDIILLKKSGDIKLLKKLNILFNELRDDPFNGTGQIEKLKYFEIPTYSRRLNKEHRLVYRVQKEEVQVLILSCYGHYSK